MDMSNVDSFKTVCKTSEEVRREEVRRIAEDVEQQQNKHKHRVNSLYKAVFVLDKLNIAAVGLSVALGAASVSLLKALVNKPAALAMEATSVTCGLFSLACHLSIGRLSIRIINAEERLTLAQSTLSQISRDLSTALDDEKLNNEEFQKIVDRHQNYRNKDFQLRQNGPV